MKYLLQLFFAHFSYHLSHSLPLYLQRESIACGNYHRIEDYEVSTSGTNCGNCFHLVIRIDLYESFQESFSISSLENFIFAADDDQTVSKLSFAIDEKVHFTIEGISEQFNLVNIWLTSPLFRYYKYRLHNRQYNYSTPMVVGNFGAVSLAATT